MLQLVQQGVGHVVAGAVIGSSVKGASAEGVSCRQAPQTQSKSSQPFAFANQSCTAKRLVSQAFKCFAALATITGPLAIKQEFLIDSGAGRNLISKKDLPDGFHSWMRPLKSFVSPQVGVLGIAVKLSAFEENQEKESFMHFQSAPQPCHLASKSMSRERAGYGSQINCHFS